MAQTITNISVDVLKIHPRNAEFFDDISGEEYERFKKSIQDDGLLSPLIVAPDMTVISGHQRLKACKELGWKSVPVIIMDDLEDEDEKLKKLIAANFGRLKNDQVKQGKLIKEYERLCGVRQGRKTEKFSVSQDDIARALGVDARTVRNLKKLAELPQELQDMISDGTITASTGYLVLSKLSEEEQLSLLAKLPAAEKFTQSQVQQYIDQIKGLTADNTTLKKIAVDSTRAANSSVDSQEYLRMKEKLERAETEIANHRAEYEGWKKEQKEEREQRKQEAADRKKREEDSKKEKEEQINLYKKEAKELRDRLSKMEEEKEVMTEPEQIEVEVVPEDYEKVKKENEQLKKKIEAMKNKEDGCIMQINDDRPREEKVKFFQEDVVQQTGGFLSWLRGARILMDYFPDFTPISKRVISENLSEIGQIQRELEYVLGGTQECNKDSKIA